MLFGSLYRRGLVVEGRERERERERELKRGRKRFFLEREE
jgi:hypothetical protein